MGYTTDFEGIFELDHPLSVELADYLLAFSTTRRMGRNLPTKPGGSEWCPYDTWGVQGEFYVYGGGHYGQERDSTILNYNDPPNTQPGLWCNWVPTEDGKGIEWDGGEKFYDYVEWLEYLLTNFLIPAGYVMNGRVLWNGEERSDVGTIIVEDNVVTIKEGL